MRAAGFPSLRPSASRPLWLRILLILTAALLVVLVFPPHGVWQLAIVAWIPLIVGLRGASAKVGFRLGLVFGLVAYGGSLIWLWEVFRWPALGLWLILACFVGVFASWFATRPGSLRARPWFGPLAAVVWTGIEYYRSEWFWLRFPWITPGTGLPPNDLSPIVGAYGCSFLIVLGTVWITSGDRWFRLAAATILIALLVSAAFRHQHPPKPTSPPIAVALIQYEEGFFDDYYALTLGLQDKVDVIVWPEYALNYDVRKNPRDMERITELLSARARIMTLGSESLRDDGKRHNTAFTFGAGGTLLGAHHKNRPVHFFDDGEPGEDLQAFNTPVGRIATPVCFDCDYTEVARKLVLDGAELILAPSMDARRWTLRQHEQHAELFRHRAAENGRWVAVAATSGVTQIIAPTGTVTARLDGMDPGVLVGEVALRHDTTFYSRFGWFLGPASTISAGLILLAAIVRGLITIAATRRSPRPAA